MKWTRKCIWREEHRCIRKKWRGINIMCMLPFRPKLESCYLCLKLNSKSSKIGHLDQVLITTRKNKWWTPKQQFGQKIESIVLAPSNLRMLDQANITSQKQSIKNMVCRNLQLINRIQLELSWIPSFTIAKSRPSLIIENRIIISLPSLPPANTIQVHPPSSNLNTNPLNTNASVPQLKDSLKTAQTTIKRQQSFLKLNQSVKS